MRFVLDTNVLMSGLYFGGKPGQIIDWWLETGHEILATEAVLAEYQDVFERLGKRYPTVQAKALLQLVTRRATLVPAVDVPLDACSDVDDLKFLACALSGQSDWLVSGDIHLLAVNGWRGLHVVRPAEFVKEIISDYQ